MSAISDHDEDDNSDATFEGFEPLTEEDQEKLTKLGKLRTIEYGLKKRKRVQSYICHEGGCTFIGKSIRELNEHHVKLHKDVLCESLQQELQNTLIPKKTLLQPRGTKIFLQPM